MKQAGRAQVALHIVTAASPAADLIAYYGGPASGGYLPRARTAREIVDGAGSKRVTSLGARHVHPLIAPTMEYSAVVGGCAGCATPLGAQLAGLQGASGTMPHAMILLFGDTVKAALAFDEQMGDDVLRIVLVDTFKDEAEEALRVAEALGKRLRGVRLDTPGERGGETADLVQEGRARLDPARVRPARLFISGGAGAARNPA